MAGSSVSFDLSAFEIFAPLAWGGAVLLVQDSKEMANLPDAAPTLINTVPSAMELLQLERLPASIRVVNLAAEPLSPSLVRRVYEKTKAAKVFDLYGPTECTTYSTFALREPHSPALSPVPHRPHQAHVSTQAAPRPSACLGTYWEAAGWRGVNANAPISPAKVRSTLFLRSRGTALRTGRSYRSMESRISWTW